jgi:hypothetical protein
MTNRIGTALGFVAIFCIAMTAQTEPTLNVVNLPKYPPFDSRPNGV